MGQKNEAQVLQKLREEYDFSYCSLAQPLTDLYLISE